MGRENLSRPRLRGFEAWGNKTKEMFYSSLSLKKISFVLFPQVSQPCMNFNMVELVYFVFVSTKWRNLKKVFFFFLAFQKVVP